MNQTNNNNDYHNVIVGYTTPMPIVRDGLYRRCYAGECEIGNLFVDAARWKSQTNIGFMASGGFRGFGWSSNNNNNNNMTTEGGGVPVTLADLYMAMPFPNTLCQGVMSGTSIYRLFRYSISAATFEGILTTTGQEGGGGDRLLQVSGIRVTYNTQLPDQQRIVQLELIQEEDETTTTNHTTTTIYEPIQQENLYSFVTDSFICDAFTPYPSLVGLEELNLQIGEIPGTIDDDDDMIIQTVVADYLSYLHRNGSDRIYIAEIQGRLVNNTNIMDGLDWLTSTQPSNIPSLTPSSSIHPSLDPSSGPTNSAIPSLLPSSAPRGSNAAPSSITSLTPSSLPTTTSIQQQTILPSDPTTIGTSPGNMEVFPSSSAPSSIPSSLPTKRSPTISTTSEPTTNMDAAPSRSPTAENKNEIPTLSPQSSSILPSSQPSSSPSTIPSTGTSKMVASVSSTTPSLPPASPTLLPLPSPSSNAPFKSCRVTYLCLLLGMLIVVNSM